MHERDFSEEREVQNLESYESVNDYSKYGLENDWFNDPEAVEGIMEAIKDKTISERDVSDLYAKFHAKVNETNPDPSEDLTFEEVQDQKRLNEIANNILIAATSAYPNIALEGSMFKDEVYDPVETPEKHNDVIDAGDTIN